MRTKLWGCHNGKHSLPEWKETHVHRAPPHLLFNLFSFELSTSFLYLDLEGTVYMCHKGSALTLKKAFCSTHHCSQITHGVTQEELLKVSFLKPHLCSAANWGEFREKEKEEELLKNCCVQNWFSRLQDFHTKSSSSEIQEQFHFYNRAEVSHQHFLAQLRA